MKKDERTKKWLNNRGTQNSDEKNYVHQLATLKAFKFWTLLI